METKITIKTITTEYTNISKQFNHPTFTLDQKIEETMLMELTDCEIIFKENIKKKIKTPKKGTSPKQPESIKIQLHHLKIEDNLSEASKERGKTFQLKETREFKQRTFLIIFGDKKERDHWKTQIKEQINCYKKQRIFGMDLSELHEIHGELLPKFVTQCIDIIKSNPGDVMSEIERNELDEMIQQINKTGETTISNSIQAWSLIKYFLLSLPSPLLSNVSKYLSEDIQISTIQRQLNTIPSENLSLLEKMFELFNYLSTNYSQLYSRKLLAHTFALFIVYQKGETIPIEVFDLMELFISSFEEIFHGDNDEFNEIDTDIDQNENIGQYHRLSNENKFVVMSNTPNDNN